MKCIDKISILLSSKASVRGRDDRSMADVEECLVDVLIGRNGKKIHAKVPISFVGNGCVDQPYG